VARGWRRLHNEEPQSLNASLIIRAIKSRRTRLAEDVARMEEMRNVYYILVGKPERKRPLVRPSCRWEDVDYMHVAEDKDQLRALVKTVMNLLVP